MLRLIADDLTGAADAAVAFVGSRVPVTIALAGRGAGAGSARGDGAPRLASGVLALDTATRDRSEDEAAQALRDALADVAPGDEVVLKIDSLLRGHVARSVATLREALPDRAVVVAPAFPAVGRVQTAAELAAAIRADDVETFAARSDADLDALVAARAGAPTAWVGSGGITRALARRATSRTAPDVRLRGPFLAVIGSTARVAREQVAALAARASHVERGGAGLARRAARENLVVTSPDPQACAAAAARTNLLLLSGGATARAVLECCGVTELDVVAELEPGVVALRAAPLDALIVTKSGSFGDPGTWIRIVER